MNSMTGDFYPAQTWLLKRSLGSALMAGGFFLFRQEKVTKKNATPGAAVGFADFPALLAKPGGGGGYVRSWPGVRVRHVATKLTLAETASAANGSSSKPPGTHTPGQEQTVTVPPNLPLK